MVQLLKISAIGAIFLLTSCSTIGRYRAINKNRNDLRDERIERCVHRLIDKGVTFTEAATMCEEKIYAKRKI